MTFDEIAEIVLATIKDVSGAEEVTLDEEFSRPLSEGGLGFDDLDHLSLIMNIEEILNMDIEERIYSTPRELAQYIHSLKPQRRHTAWEDVKTRLHLKPAWGDFPAPAKE